MPLKKLGEELDRICHRADVNQLKLNAGRTKGFVKAPNTSLKTVPNISILLLNNNPIKYYPTVKKFGISFDQTHGEPLIQYFLSSLIHFKVTKLHSPHTST